VVAGQPQSLPAERTPSLPPLPLPTSTIAPPLGECTVSKDTAPYASRHPWVVLDDTWRVAVHLDAPGTAPVEAVRYTEGRVERIHGVPSRFELTSVNRAGVFAGVSLDNDRGWVYRDGKFTGLRLPQGMTDIALTGINDAGDLVGTVVSADDTRFAAVVWPAGHPDRPRVLEVPDGQSSRAYSIAWDGTAVGEVFDANGMAPYLWHADGTGEHLPLPQEWATPQDAPWGRGNSGTAVVNLAGDWVGGWGVRWNIRTGQADVIKGLQGPGTADVYGRIYGESEDSGNQSVVWINGSVQPAPTVQSMRWDGRRGSVPSSSGGWDLWTCGD
jgi:hypothetical protein